MLACSPMFHTNTFSGPIPNLVCLRGELSSYTPEIPSSSPGSGGNISEHLPWKNGTRNFRYFMLKFNAKRRQTLRPVAVAEPRSRIRIGVAEQPGCRHPTLAGRSIGQGLAWSSMAVLEQKKADSQRRSSTKHATGHSPL